MIFVSHARKDKPVIDVFVEKVLQLGFGISPKLIFYSSHPDTGIPGGDYINGTIFTHIRDSELIILFLSKNYFDSAYCLCEMGASRLLYDGKTVFLFLFPDLNYDDVEGVFVENMIKKIDINGMDSLMDTIHRVCPPQEIRSRPSAPKRRIDEFLSIFPDAIKKVKPPVSVSLDEYTMVKEQCETLKLELNKIEEEILEKNNYIAKLEQVKDAEQVEIIKPMKTKKVEEVYKELLASAKSELNVLTKDGKVTFFYFWKYGEEEANRRIRKENLEIESDLDDDRFTDSGHGVKLGVNSCGISNNIDAIISFLEGDNLEKLCIKYGFKESDFNEFRENLPENPLNDKSYWREELF